MIHAMGARATGLRLERIQSISRFADGAFHNTAQVASGLGKKGTGGATISEYLWVASGARRPVSSPRSIRALLVAPKETSLRATWLGHSLVLLEMDGVRCLPIRSGRPCIAGDLRGAQALSAGAGAMAALPPLDAVVISHDHYDHLDYPTILELAKGDVPFFTSLGVGAAPRGRGVPASAHHRARLWESAKLPRAGLTHHGGPVAAFSGRGREGAMPPCVVARPASEHASVFFSGDGLYPGIHGDCVALGPFDLGDARGRCLSSGVGHSPGARHALEGARHAGKCAFCRCTGALQPGEHAWDDAAETLVAAAPSRARGW